MKEHFLLEKEYMEKKEYAFLDYLRVVAILAVIIMHVMINVSKDFIEPGNIFYNYILYNKFADYLFFMLTGFSFAKYKTNISIKKTIQLVLKRYIGLTLFAIIYNFIERLWTLNLLFDDKMLIDAIVGGICGYSWDHLWFMYHLLIIYLLMPILLIIYKNNNKYLPIIFALFLFVLNFLGVNIYIKLPLPLLSMMPFSAVLLSVTCGAILYRYDFVNMLSKIIFILTTIFMTIVWFKVPVVFNYIDREFFIIVFAINIFALFYKLFNYKNNFFATLSSHNYIVYLIHVLFLHLITKVLKLNPYSFAGMIGIVIFALIIYFLSILSAVIIENIPYIGKLYKKR